MTLGNAPRDNRRLAVRVFSQHVLQILTDTARDYDVDLIAFLICTAVWTANTRRLPPFPTLRFGAPDDVPPDRVREPIPLDLLAEEVRIPRATVAVYVRELTAKGLLEETPAGFIVPAAVVSGSVETLKLSYTRIQAMARALRTAGVTLEDR